MQPGVCEAAGCMLMLGAELMVIALCLLVCMQSALITVRIFLLVRFGICSCFAPPPAPALP